jgi:hypothetical protein
MLPSSSSTSNSDSGRLKGRARQRILGILLWTIGALFLIDFTVGLAFRPPSDPRRTLSSLQNYFEYGRSIEGKLRRIVGSSPELDSPIVKAGWLVKECDVETSTPPGKRGFDVYGMSFSNEIAIRLERLDPRLVSQRFGGPAAPPNHSYACFNRRYQAGLRRAPVQILGVLASSVRRMITVTGLTTSFEQPQPFTYPRYSIRADGQLEGSSSSISTEDDLRVALADPVKWRAFLNDLSSNDAFYERRMFQADIFDYSVLARMFRRAWGQRTLRERTAALHAVEGFSGAPEIAPVLRAMLLDFATKARAAGEHPVVILFEDQGYGRALSAIAAPMLQANGIDFVATSAIVSPDDSGNFVADGHFTPAANEKISYAVIDLLHRAR